MIAVDLAFGILRAVAGSALGRLVLVGGLAFAAGAWQGWAMKSRLDRSAAYRAEIAVLRADLGAARDQAARAAAALETIEKSNADNQERIRELSDAVAARPPGDRCALSADDARRLRGLR